MAYNAYTIKTRLILVLFFGFIFYFSCFYLSEQYKLQHMKVKVSDYLTTQGYKEQEIESIEPFIRGGGSIKIFIVRVEFRDEKGFYYPYSLSSNGEVYQIKYLKTVNSEYFIEHISTEINYSKFKHYEHTIK